MAESLRLPSAPAAGERDALLATKLHIPRPRPGFLARPRLLERLTEGTARELTLVCAPAGFGKTSLVGDWARASRRPVAWLSLDQADSDPARFWRYVAAALDQVHAGIGGRVGALLRSPEPASLEALVTVVVNQPVTEPEEVVLVLDDYHLVEAPAVHHSREILPARRTPSSRPSGSHQPRAWPACSTPSRPCGRGCRWPRTAPTRPWGCCGGCTPQRPDKGGSAA